MSHQNVRDDPRIKAGLQEALNRGEIGLAVAAYYQGKLIVDAFAGKANVKSGQLVDEHTIFPVFSVTKGVTALAIHMQAARGLLSLDQPIAKYWPEFGINGKETITIEQALSHRAGIPQMPAGVTPVLMADWGWMVKEIANFTPVYTPGKFNAYHVLVWGWILGEVVVRTDPVHRPFGVFVREEICDPLKINDFFMGVPDADLDRVATLYGGNDNFMMDEHGVSPKAVFPGSDVHNLRVVQQTCDPGAGAIASASAVAKIFALIAEGGELDGVRLLPREYVKGLIREREGAHDQDKVLPIPVWFGAAGYWLGGEPNASSPLVGSHRNIIYSPGAGGSIAWADIQDRIAVAICHNNMDAGVIAEPESIFAPVIRAVREVIAQHQKGQ